MGGGEAQRTVELQKQVMVREDVKSLGGGYIGIKASFLQKLVFSRPFSDIGR